MESLLCDEVWPSNNPATPENCHEAKHQLVFENHINGDSFYTTKEYCEQSFNIFLQKESSYMPAPGYIELLQSQNLILARFKAIQWFIKSRTRLNLSIETVFNAANYLDRFISMNHCHRSESWIIELASIASLSIASKFSETCNPSLHEIQMEGLDHSFQSSKILHMEFILLQTLGWRLSSTTPFSYVELLPWKFDPLININFHKKITTRVTELLLGAILDSKLLEYRPSVIAISALWCSLEELIPLTFNVYFNYITRFFDQDQMEELVKCHMIMVAGSVNPLHYCPSSPVSVLLTQGSPEVSDCQCDISFTKLPSSNDNILESSKKRMRTEQ